MQRTGRLLLVVTAVAAVASAWLRWRRGRLRQGEIRLFTDPPPAGVAPPQTRRGERRDRGRAAAYQLDLHALRQAQGFEPVIQYLTYIQSQRGDTSHLLFVRYDDLDALAHREGLEVPAFLHRLDQLGVVVSTN